MSDTLIITFVAHDRPGIIERLAKIVTENGGNWLESRMTNLAGMFAGVARVSLPDGKSDALGTSLNALGDDIIQVMVHPADRVPTPSGPVIAFDIVGPDHPGIVHELTRTIAGLGASVEDMETRIESAPVDGGTLFYAETKVRLPSGLSDEEFRDALENSASALFVDIAINTED